MRILERVLEKIKPGEKERGKMEKRTQEFVDKLEKKIKKSKAKAEVFVGGSSGKGTVVKRKKQDIDIFVRFGEEKDISKLLEKSLAGFRKKKIRGSRDYFKVKFKGLSFEVVPVLKINKPEQAKNITDLSYFHVSYIKNKLKKNRRLGGEIMLAKSFAYAQDCYGAESYIRGFSGYALELLLCKYGSFINLVKGIVKLKLGEDEKLVVDLEKHYKSKQEVMEEMNEAKLASPIIFVDPTYKERNALAGLSYETFYKFQNACKKFLKNPSIRYFERNAVDAKRYNFVLKAKTSKQEGDIAGSKLWKFYLLISRELEKYFFIGKNEFEYDDKKTGNYYFKIKKKKQITIEGPPVIAVKNVVKFKRKHKKVYVKGGKVYAREKGISIDRFLSNFKKSNKKRMRDMGITGFGVD